MHKSHKSKDKSENAAESFLCLLCIFVATSSQGRRTPI
jgi:hypothetical protein